MTLDMEESSSTIRLVLGSLLKEARLAAKMELSQLQKFKLGSSSTISRIEKGQVPVLPFRVVAMCKVYGLDQATTDHYESLAFRASESTIYDEFSDLIPQWFSVFVKLEATAEKIDVWDGSIITGLLQTPAYSQALFECHIPTIESGTIGRLLKIRSQRQLAVFTRSDVCLRIVLGAGVLAQEVGGPVIAQEQRAHMQEINSAKQADIRILPFTAGAHMGMAGPFTFLDAPGLRNVVYSESASGANYVDKAAKIARYREVFQSLYDRSVPLEEYIL